MSMRNSIDTFGDRTRDLSACSAVPQPSALPRVPDVGVRSEKINYLASCDNINYTALHHAESNWSFT